MEYASKYDFLIAADEEYQLLYWGSAPPPPMSALDDPTYAQTHQYIFTYLRNPRVLSMGSFSKILGPGLRVGWIETRGKLLDRVINCGLVSLL